MDSDKDHEEQLERMIESARIKQYNIQENKHQKRIYALYTGDYRLYARLNIDLGVEPEDMYAHERGLMP